MFQFQAQDIKEFQVESATLESTLPRFEFHYEYRTRNEKAKKKKYLHKLKIRIDFNYI